MHSNLAVDVAEVLYEEKKELAAVVIGRFGFSFDAVFATWKTSKCIFNTEQARARTLLFSCFAEELTKSDTLLHSSVCSSSAVCTHLL